MAEKIKVYAQNTNFTGVRNTESGQVVFKRGVADCTEKQAAELEAKGYKLNKADIETEDEKIQDAPVDVDEATKKLMDDAIAEAEEYEKGAIENANTEAERIKTEATEAADQIKADAEGMVFEKAYEIIKSSEQAKERKFLKTLAGDIKAHG